VVEQAARRIGIDRQDGLIRSYPPLDCEDTSFGTRAKYITNNNSWHVLLCLVYRHTRDLAAYSNRMHCHSRFHQFFVLGSLLAVCFVCLLVPVLIVEASVQYIVSRLENKAEKEKIYSYK
jgi:hypothetical protein